MLYDSGPFAPIVMPLNDLWQSTLAFLPLIISALVVFIVGLVIATGLGTLVEKILERIKLDRVLRQLGVEQYVERAGMTMKSGRFFGQIVFWFIAIAFLIASSDILGLAAFSSFLNQVVTYIPQLVVGILMMLAAVVVANVARKTVNASMRSARMPAAHFLGSLTWWAIVVFGLLATLSQLGVASGIMQSVVTGFIAMVALAGGLAFGLGGKEYAGHLLDKFRGSGE